MRVTLPWSWRSGFPAAGGSVLPKPGAWPMRQSNSSKAAQLPSEAGRWSPRLVWQLHRKHLSPPGRTR